MDPDTKIGQENNPPCKQPSREEVRVRSQQTGHRNGGINKQKKSVVDVACGFVALAQDAFSSFSNSAVCACVAEIRAASFEENVLGCHVDTVDHSSEYTSLLCDTLFAPKLLAFSEIPKILP